MRVCLDTNVLARLFVPHPPFTEILDGILGGEVCLLISNEILLEYEEVITREFGLMRWKKIETFLEAISKLYKTVAMVERQFRFSVIPDDPDDNKFVDCAIAGEADYVVTYDGHFEALRTAGYKAKPLKPEMLARFL